MIATGPAMSLEAQIWQLICAYPMQAGALAFMVAVTVWSAMYGDASGDGDGGWLDSFGGDSGDGGGD